MLVEDCENCPFKRLPDINETLECVGSWDFGQYADKIEAAWYILTVQFSFELFKQVQSSQRHDFIEKNPLRASSGESCGVFRGKAVDILVDDLQYIR